MGAMIVLIMSSRPRIRFLPAAHPLGRAHMKAASSRAIAVTATVLRLPCAIRAL
ncbi:hypothetical protein X745_32510 [Mesorhizobium sp. LNJC374B00]|nr:hypothetical protein X745_32510 [Mesorhizobium sp. LNJC374B00]